MRIVTREIIDSSGVEKCQFSMISTIIDYLSRQFKVEY